MPQKRRNPPARYQLPTVVHPSSHKCFVIQVPNDIYHIAAFRGQLEALARAYTWGNDDAHTALDAASVWRTVIDNMESCMPALQFRQPNNCTLEVSTDGGFTWSPIFNSYNCALDAIASEIANGTLQSGGVSQPPAGGTVPSNVCQSYHVVLSANERWHSPVPVTDGYSITISNVKGGWSDGYAIGSYWQCPDGEYYSLGYCTGSFIAGYAGDPIPSLYHMRLIGHAGVYFDAYDTTYIVPNGTGNVDLTFQANDSDISDNLGSIEFDVSICNYSNWCHYSDFKVAKDGYYNDDFDTWVSGYGFALGSYGSYKAISLVKDIASGANITSMEFCIEANHSYAGNWGGFYYNPSFHGLSGDYPVATACHTWSLSASGVTKIGTRPSTGDMSQVAYIVSAKVIGTGVNPFGSSNC